MEETPESEVMEVPTVYLEVLGPAFSQALKKLAVNWVFKFQNILMVPFLDCDYIYIYDIYTSVFVSTDERCLFFLKGGVFASVQ